MGRVLCPLPPPCIQPQELPIHQLSLHRAAFVKKGHLLLKDLT